MADILNFNKARKQRDRKAAQAQAAENRLLFGRSKAEKAADAAAAQEAARRLDGLRREPESPASDQEKNTD